MAKLIRHVARESELKKAWRSIKHRPDSRGFDDQTIREFELNLSSELQRIRAELLTNKYKFTPLKGVALPKKPDWSEIRPLKITAVRDRVLQKSIEQTIRKYVKTKYRIENPASYAYIRNRSVEHAAIRINRLYRSGCSWIYKGDIVKFFDRVDTKKLLTDFIFPCLPDDSLNKLIEDALSIELGNGAELQRRGWYDDFPAAGSGIPQGGTLSPLFANVYLNPLDEGMLSRGFKLIRYADDFVVMCKSKEEAVAADKLAREIVESQLNLEIYPTHYKKSADKTSLIVPFNDIDFLGIRFQGSKMYPGTKQFKKIVGLLKSKQKVSVDTSLMRELNYIKMRVDNWGANYHYTSYDKALYQALDKHLVQTVNSLLSSCGYKPLAKKTVDMDRIGVSTFTQKLDYYKTKKLERAQGDK